MQVTRGSNSVSCKRCPLVSGHDRLTVYLAQKVWHLSETVWCSDAYCVQDTKGLQREECTQRTWCHPHIHTTDTTYVYITSQTYITPHHSTAQTQTAVVQSLHGFKVLFAHCNTHAIITLELWSCMCYSNCHISIGSHASFHGSHALIMWVIVVYNVGAGLETPETSYHFKITNHAYSAYGTCQLPPKSVSTRMYTKWANPIACLYCSICTFPMWQRIFRHFDLPSHRDMHRLMYVHTCYRLM